MSERIIWGVLYFVIELLSLKLKFHKSTSKSRTSKISICCQKQTLSDCEFSCRMVLVWSCLKAMFLHLYELVANKFHINDVEGELSNLPGMEGTLKVGWKVVVV